MSSSFNNYTIERISAERLKDLLILFRDSFGRDTSLSFYQKKFATQYSGAEYIGYIAYDENQNPAAYYGLYPCIASYNEKEIIAAVSGDTMTHSAHRGKGLFVELAKKTFALAKTEGIQFAYGFPNQNSLPGSLKAGWTYSGEKMRRYVFSVTTIPLSKIFRVIPLLQSLYHWYTMAILSFYSSEKKSFPNSIIEEKKGGVLHDENFFRYKNYTENKIAKINGIAAWLKIDGELKIGDVDRRKDFDFNQWMKSLKRLSFFLGCTQISFLTAPDTWLDKILSERFSFRETFLVARIDFGSDVPIEQY